MIIKDFYKEERKTGKGEKAQRKEEERKGNTGGGGDKISK